MAGADEARCGRIRPLTEALAVPPRSTTCTGKTSPTTILWIRCVICSASTAAAPHSRRTAVQDCSAIRRGWCWVIKLIQQCSSSSFEPYFFSVLYTYGVGILYTKKRQKKQINGRVCAVCGPGYDSAPVRS